MDTDYKGKVGDLVTSHDHHGVYKVLAVSESGRITDLQLFVVSKQLLVGQVMKGIPSSRLTPFKEDASQAAARIVREATEQK